MRFLPTALGQVTIQGTMCSSIALLLEAAVIVVRLSFHAKAHHLCTARVCVCTSQAVFYFHVSRLLEVPVSSQSCCQRVI
jgi:hypothetical protein